MNKPLVSVVVPVYNTSSYLKQCINSLLNQSLHDVEFIFVDDGSTDNSIEIIEQYRRKDGRIKVLRQENQYAGVARNYGMKEATGEYIIFLDSDDYFESVMLQDAYQCAEKTRAEIVIFGYNEFDDQRKRDKKRKLTERVQFPQCVFSANDLGDELFFKCNAAPWNKLFSRGFVDKHHLQFEARKKCNDTYFVHMAVALAERMIYINKKYVHYRVENQSSLQGAHDKNREAFVEAGISIKKGLNEAGKYNGSIRVSAIKYAQALVEMGIKPPYTKEALEEYYLFAKTHLVPDLFDLSSEMEEGSVARDIYESTDFSEFLCRQLQKEKLDKENNFVPASSWEVRVGKALLAAPKGVVRYFKG